jgi:two-component system, cell cycle sensor histidine kinase and response regulator CckA
MVGVDVTDYRALQEQQRQGQKLESLGRLASGVAHDFNNLLTVMNGYADLALKMLEPDDAVRSMVEQIRKAGGQAARLTGQLLAIGRKEAAPPKTLDVNQTVEDTAAMLRPMMGPNVEMVLRLGAGVGRIVGDPAQITRVVINLALNARDAMPAGGRLTIETARAEPGEAPVPALPPVGYVMITVADTGVGMDGYVREHMFEPFFTTKAEGCGTGLGLATVQTIVRQYGGGIAVDSTPGGGSVFRVRLPRPCES